MTTKISRGSGERLFASNESPDTSSVPSRRTIVSATLGILGFVAIVGGALCVAVIAFVMFTGAPHAFPPAPAAGWFLLAVSGLLLVGAGVVLRRTVRTLRQSRSERAVR